MALNSSIVVADTVATAAQYNNLRKDVIVKAGEYAVTTGSANAYVLAIDAQYVAYTAGDAFVFKTNFANTGSCTVNVNTIGAKTMKDVEGNTLATGSILNGAILHCQYDGTDVIVLSGLFATATNKGDVEMLTDAEATTGTDETRYLNAKQAKDNYLIVTDVVVTTRDLSTASGTQVVNHSLGKIPRRIDFIVLLNTTSSSYGTNTVGGSNKSVSFPNGTATQSSSNCIEIYSSAGATGGTATVSATSTTTFTINWTKVGSGTGTAQIIATLIA